ncbi:MAG: thrombospondin type 3 repeat-containing protein [Acidobacteriota bacterium]
MAWGRPDARQPLGAPAPLGRHDHVEYDHGPVVEWYHNRLEGLKQGFTVAHAPTGHGPLVVDLELAGDLTPWLSPAGDAVDLRDATGRSVLRYAGLETWDVTGRRLTTRLELVESGLDRSVVRLSVDDTAAVYPVVIDPTWTQKAKILAPEGEPGALFGTSVAIAGDSIVIGASGNDTTSVFVANDEGVQDGATLESSHDLVGTGFGYSVGASNDLLVVGAPFDDESGAASGSAFIYEREDGSWIERARLTAPDPQPGQRFGAAVAAGGDTIVVGAIGDDTFGTDAGAVHVFQRSESFGWEHVVTLGELDATAGDLFGFSVDTDGLGIIVGLPFDDDRATNAGASVLYERHPTDGWLDVTRERFTADAAAPHDRFGRSVSIDGDTVVVGADMADGLFRDAGAALVFERHPTDGWLEVSRFESSDPHEAELFGQSVSVHGTSIAIGARSDLDGRSEAGSASLFERHPTDGWLEVTRIGASDGMANDDFGSAVSIGDGRLVVGARHADPDGDRSGAAYYFVIEVVDLDGDGTDDFFDNCPDLPNSSQADADEDGVGDDCDNCIEVPNPGQENCDDLGFGDACEEDPGLRDDDGDGTCNDMDGCPLDPLDDRDGDGLCDSEDNCPDVSNPGQEDPDGDGRGEACAEATWCGWELHALDGQEGDGFGVELSATADRLLVATSLEEGRLAYLFEPTESGHWLETARLTLSPDTLTVDFGRGEWRLAGDSILVGSHTADNVLPNAGVIIRLERAEDGSWFEDGLLIPDEPAMGAFFGYSVAGTADRVAAGALTGNMARLDSPGSVHVFDRNEDGDWVETAKLITEAGLPSDRFGASVAVSGDVVAAGAPWSGAETFLQCGAVHVFEKDVSGEWTESHLVAVDAAMNAELGETVAVSGGIVAAGAPSDPEEGEPVGAVYVFEQDEDGNWAQRAKLLDTLGGRAFGQSLSLVGEHLVVGAAHPEHGGTTHVFRRRAADDWELVSVLLARDSDDRFGKSVALVGNQVAVGAPLADRIAVDSGAVEFFELTHDGTDGDGVGACADNCPSVFNPEQEDADGDGIGDACDSCPNSPEGDPDDDGVCSDVDNCPDVPNPTQDDADGDGWGDACRAPAWCEARLSSSGERRFGQSTSLHQDRLAVGVPAYGLSESSAGAVRLYRPDTEGTWQVEDVLFGSDTDPDDSDWTDEFGSSVALHRDTLVVGDVNFDRPEGGNGIVYVFERRDETWQEVTKLAVDDPDSLSRNVGRTVALHGDRAVFSDHDDVYVFERGPLDTWAHSAKLNARDQELGDGFGHAIVIEGDTLLASSPWRNDGVVHVFTHDGSGWVERFPLDFPESEESLLGWGLALHGDLAVAGAPEDDSAGNDAGAVVVFERDERGSWLSLPPTRLVGSETEAESRCGESVAISGDTILVGCEGADEGRGRVLVYRRDTGGTWRELPSLSASDADAEQDGTSPEFGAALALHEDRVAVGAPHSRSEGAVYTYRLHRDADDGDRRSACADNCPLDYNPFQEDRDEDGLGDACDPCPSDPANDEDGDGHCAESDNCPTVSNSDQADRDGDGVGDACDGPEWCPEELAPEDLVGDDLFGSNVATDGPWMAVSAIGHDDFDGAVYLFERQGTGWREVTKLTSELDHYFGHHLALSGNRLVVGALGGALNERTDPGSVTVFELRDGSWERIARFLPEWSTDDDGFGHRVALQGDQILVTSDLHPEGPRLGVVHVFELEGEEWIETDRLFPDAAGPRPYFGSSLSVDGDRLAVGLGEAHDLEGAVDLYERDEDGRWQWQSRLRAPGAESGDGLGWNVLLRGDLVFSATQHEGETGIVHVFERSDDGTWLETGTLQGLQPDDRFGSSLDLLGNRLAVQGLAPEVEDSTVRVRLFEMTPSGEWIELDSWLVPEASHSGLHNQRLTLSDQGLQVGAWSANDSKGAVRLHRYRPVDDDGDRVDACLDNCPDVFNPLQVDLDRDGQGDACDPCPRDPHDDEDDDGHCADRDNCPTVPNPDQADRDGDGAGNACDSLAWCPDELSPDGLVGDDLFGSNVITDGSWMAVSALGHDDFAGAVHLFERQGTGWREVVMLTSELDHQFGRHLALSGNRLVVGALGGALTERDNPGSVTVFELRDGSWERTARFLPEQSADNDGFGHRVAFQGDQILVTSDLHPEGPRLGVVHVFELEGEEWIETDLLLPDVTGPWASFGASLSIDGDRLAIGHPEANDHEGAVELYERDEDGRWRWQSRLRAMDAQPDESLGWAVQLRGDLLLAGARGQGEAGAVHEFRRGADGTWTETDRLVGLPPRGRFGESFGLSGDLLAVFAYATDVANNTSRVHLFETSPAGGWSEIDSWLMTDVIMGTQGNQRLTLTSDGLQAGARLANDRRGAVRLHRYRPIDDDGDMVDACLDNCPDVVNPLQADLDDDGQGDACDPCPSDPDDGCSR